MEQVTLEKLQEFGSVSQAIEWAQKQYGTYPKPPIKPLLSVIHTSDDVGIYQKNLQHYEKAYEEYKKEKESWVTNQRVINKIIEQYIKDQSGIDSIPEQYRDKLYSKAYEDGHSNGYYEVYLKLISLIEIFD